MEYLVSWLQIMDHNSLVTRFDVLHSLVTTSPAHIILNPMVGCCTLWKGFTIDIIWITKHFMVWYYWFSCPTLNGKADNNTGTHYRCFITAVEGNVQWFQILALLIQELVQLHLAVVALALHSDKSSINVCEAVSSGSDKQWSGQEWCSDSPSMASPPHITVDEILCPQEMSGPMNHLSNQLIC